MAKRVKCGENEKRESPRYILKNEIRPGREYICTVVIWVTGVV